MTGTLFNKLLSHFRAQSPPSENHRIPNILETRLLGVSARFEAITSEDYGRILRFDGESDYYREILKEVEDDDCFWDIGSFIGLVAVLVAKKRPNSRIVAVEPDKSFCARIGKHLALNNISNVELLEIGLSDEMGVLRLNTSGATGWAPSFYDKGLKRYAEVPVSTLDQICMERPQLCPNVLKIDVEGFEAKVIRGSAMVLQSQKLRAIFLELHPTLLLQNGERIGDLLARIEKYGFRFRSFQGRRNEILAIALK